MNTRCLKTLEYTTIINQLSSYAQTPNGIAACKALVPSNDINEIRENQRNTTDALVRILRQGSISFSGVREISDTIKRLEIGSTIGIIELLSISSLLDVAARIKAYSKKIDDTLPDDTLDSMFHSIEPLTQINNEIKRCIISEELISDDASTNLKNIRRSLRNTSEQLKSHLNSLISSQTYKSYLQDSLITMRDGRYCLPIKSEYKSQVPGMIHDQSSSGSTLFIEPASVVKYNNDLRELAIKEHNEIEVITATLSDLVAQHVETISLNLSTLGQLDYIFAKATLSREFRCSEPTFNNKQYINLKNARHPLIDKYSVVPVSVTLGDNYSMLIITGPNTGGKTVTLKTVGLLTLMGQAGLHIPADEGSVLCIFDEVYADIGDEQSIAQSLSTFSSHMTNTIDILNQVSCESLVLFDELGAGTDPTEGAALAMSILTFLNNMKVRVIATTHYSELKMFALSTPGVTNACCEFNVETLRPTYKLLIGIPGKSNAFAISQKLGLPDYIIDNAKSYITTDEKKFEDIITDLENDKRSISLERAQIDSYKKEIEELKKQLKLKHENIDVKREKILNNANEKAQEILEEAKRLADETIKNIHKYAKNGDVSNLENERRIVRDKLNSTQSHLAYKPKKKNVANNPEDFKIGDAVHILSMGVDGLVTQTANSNNELTIRIGFMNTSVKLSDIIHSNEPIMDITEPKATKGSSSDINISKASNISPEINLIGLNSDDAISKLDKYLDDAYMSHLNNIRIVHGKGTGTLRASIQRYLKSLKYVDSFHTGEYGEGDAGVTIVVFK